MTRCPLVFCRFWLAACLSLALGSNAAQADALKVKPVVNSSPARILFVGNAYRADGAIDETLAAQLQQVAQDVVMQFFQRN